MDKVLIVAAVSVAGLVVVAVVHSFLRRAAAKRLAALTHVAADLGFDFAPADAAALPEEFAGYWLFAHGDTKRSSNHFRGTTADLDVLIFDYRYTTGHGKNRQTHQQTIVRFRHAELDLPRFTLRPESFWHKVGALFGASDINFDSHPGFSKAYLLKGNREDAIRALFSEPVLDYFQERRGLCVEANDGDLLFYRDGERAKIDRYREFLEEGFEVFGLFRAAPPTA